MTAMKKPGERNPAAESNAVDAYLAAVPEPARSTLEKIRATIRSAAPAEATEAIGYRMPTFRYKGALVAYAAFKSHCSLFPMNASLLEAFKDELKEYKTSKGTIRFPMDKPLPATLVKKLVKARVAENEQNKGRRPGRTGGDGWIRTSGSE
jgi:uncharacterized protein YdhG (YjbR/CyaY superfamily)